VLVGPLRPHSGEPTATDAVVVLYVADLEQGVLRRREVLRELYGLTEAETQLVELLCQGSSLDEAAGARGVTLNTARSQLKQVFAKTHTSRQSELVRLVISGVARSRARETSD
jgi:DNA-binding CsgD family transcriptional regulator